MPLIKPFIRPLPFGFQRPLDVRQDTGSRSINIERAVVRSVGGTPNHQLLGPDGHTNGVIQRPIEVKEATKDFRYRVGFANHKKMLEEGGIYVFVAPNGARKQMSAREADSLLAYGWLSDQRKAGGTDYLHSFIFVKDIFG